MESAPDVRHLNTSSDADKLEITVCVGPQCSQFGADDLRLWCRTMEQAHLSLELLEVHCTGNCDEAPVVCWNQTYMTEVTAMQLTERLIDEGWFV
ncbi:MAG: NAD(P)H-dependent oxidoreductase subunit E [Acidobacteria bacterium]|nr:NAD(P)H-dependent oxidoreductase subunit E [Acidobacteriota bacterium]